MSIVRTGRHVMETTSEAATVQFEACAHFRGSADDLLVCACGWFEEDHSELAAVRSARLRRAPRTLTLPVRRAS